MSLVAPNVAYLRSELRDHLKTQTKKALPMHAYRWCCSKELLTEYLLVYIYKSQ